MTVQRLGKERYSIDVSVTVGDQTKRKQERFRGSKAAAHEREVEIRRELSALIFVPAVKPTVAEFSNELLAHSRANCKPSDTESKQSILKHHIIPAFGDVKVHQVTRESIERFKADLLTKTVRGGKPISRKTINNILAVLSRLLRLAVEYQRIAHAPKVQLLKVTSKRVDFRTREEVSRLVEAASSELWRTMILVAARAGLRQGELLALRWENVDLSSRRVHVVEALAKGQLGLPKNHQLRTVPLSMEATTALGAYRGVTRTGLVWPAEDGGFMPYWIARTALWATCRAAGVPKSGWHTLRHSFASHLVMAGVPLRSVQELLGHLNAKQTEIYSHLAPEFQADAVDLLDG